MPRPSASEAVSADYRQGGLGKSTAALCCLCNGLDYIGDDYVLVQLGPIPTVHSLYCTAKLNHDQMARFAKLADLARRTWARERKGSDVSLSPTTEADDAFVAAQGDCNTTHKQSPPNRVSSHLRHCHTRGRHLYHHGPAAARKSAHVSFHQSSERSAPRIRAGAGYESR